LPEVSTIPWQELWTSIALAIIWQAEKRILLKPFSSIAREPT
jgi:hypothetical protein